MTGDIKRVDRIVDGPGACETVRAEQFCGFSAFPFWFRVRSLCLHARLLARVEVPEIELRVPAFERNLDTQYEPKLDNDETWL